MEEFSLPVSGWSYYFGLWSCGKLLFYLWYFSGPFSNKHFPRLTYPYSAVRRGLIKIWQCGYKWIRSLAKSSTFQKLLCFPCMGSMKKVVLPHRLGLWNKLPKIWVVWSTPPHKSSFLLVDNVLFQFQLLRVIPFPQLVS